MFFPLPKQIIKSVRSIKGAIYAAPTPLFIQHQELSPRLPLAEWNAAQLVVR